MRAISAASISIGRGAKEHETGRSGRYPVADGSQRPDADGRLHLWDDRAVDPGGAGRGRRPGLRDGSAEPQRPEG